MLQKVSGTNFKILQLTDLHIGGTWCTRRADNIVSAHARTLVKRAKPDLIVITGDALYPMPLRPGTLNNARSGKILCGLLEEFKVPWTLALGNHDCERAKLNKDEFAAMLTSYPHCVFEKGADVSGTGNCMLPVFNRDGSINTALILLDSHGKAPGFNVYRYEEIKPDQIEWYANTVKELAEKEGRIVPSLLFFHIPLEEFSMAWDARQEHIHHFGLKRNRIKSAAVKCNLFDKVLELGSTKGIFTGHDHGNDFSITYKGVRLTSGMSLEHNVYFPRLMTKNKPRGGTLISIGDEGQFEVCQIPLK